jgi:hypothetical protein
MFYSQFGIRCACPITYTPSIPINQVVLDKILVKNWEYKSLLGFRNPEQIEREEDLEELQTNEQ